MRALADVLTQVGTEPASSGGGTAEGVLFWALAPVALGSSILMVLARKAVHSVLWLVLVFFCLAVFYVVQDAAFLGAVQVVVYAGAIMVLFLFVLMLIGVDRGDSLVETIRGQRVAALLAGVGFVGVLVGGFGRAVLDLPDTGLAEVNEDGNVRALAESLFRDHVFAFEITSALLIVAAIGAMVLTHRERPKGSRPSQRELSRARFAAGNHPTPLSGPPVLATDDDPVGAAGTSIGSVGP
jgi:NADH-quinone oxidoreductase subunit J